MIWRELANCRGMDPNSFYPLDSANEVIPLGVCKGCVVKKRCLDDALEDVTFGGFGIRGGLTERQRREISRPRRRVPA